MTLKGAMKPNPISMLETEAGPDRARALALAIRAVDQGWVHSVRSAIRVLRPLWRLDTDELLQSHPWTELVEAAYKYLEEE